jgi:hypothetical protein
LKQIKYLQLNNMKFLQVNNTENGNPKLLEMDKHFDIIWNGSLWKIREGTIGTQHDDDTFVVTDFNQCGLDNVSPFTYVCKISDCYQLCL